MSEGLSPSPEELGQVREFSRTHSQAERDETARQILDQRKQHFERQKNLSSETEQTEIARAEKEKYIESVTGEVGEMRDFLSKAENSIFTRLANFRHLRKTKQSLPTREEELVVLQSELETLSDSLGDLNQQKLVRDEMDRAKDILGEFWQGQSETWQKFEKSERARDVKNVCVDNNCFMVHAIHPTYTPGNNSLLKKGSTWQEKLQIMLALEPTISASTVHKGDNGNDNLWARMGVVLSGGRVASACRRDAATVATDVQTREKAADWTQIEDLVQGAIKDRTSSYNEFVVERPEVAGFFYCMDEEGPKSENPRTVDFGEVQPILAEYEIPLFIMQGGRMYEPVFDESGKLTGPGRELKPEDVVSAKYDINGQRSYLVESIFEEAPIKEEKFAQEEMRRVAGFQCGQEQFYQTLGLEIVGGKNLSHVPEEPYQSDGYEHISDYHIREGQTIISLGEIQRGRERSKIFISSEDGKVVIKRYKKDGTSLLKRTHSQVEGLTDEGYIDVNVSGYQSGEGLEKNIFSFEDYLDQIDKAIAKVLQQIEKDKAKRGGEDISVKMGESRFGNLCFHLSGFAEEAKKNGYDDLAQKALEVADKYISRDNIQEVVQRRVGKNGNFRLTREDLKIE